MRALIGATGLAAAALAVVARGEVINVPVDFTTIQAAIDASSNGDEIVVAPGTYHEGIRFLGRAITLRSAAGPDVTRIDATGLSTSTVRFIDAEGPAAIMDGFSISGGTGIIVPGGSPVPDGGGMILLNASPTIRNSVILLNNAHHGAGFLARQSQATFTDCRFLANVGGAGGGGMIDEGSTLQFTRCQFIANSAGTGGGALSVVDSQVIADECTFGANSGTGIIALGTLLLRRCIFAANSGGTEGGGLFVYGSADMTDCLIVHNTATNGGGLTMGAGSLALRSCSLVGNTGNGIHVIHEEATVTAGNCIFREDEPAELDVLPRASVTVVSSNVQGSWTGPGADNIDADPWFAPGPAGHWTLAPSFDPSTTFTTLTDANASFAPGALTGAVIFPTTAFALKTVVAANTATTITVVGQVWSFIATSGTEYEVLNHRLLPGSPCIDAGRNETLGPQPVDLDGNPRFVNVAATPDTGQGDCPIIDMGAYEHQAGSTECPPCPDCAAPADGIVDVVDFLAILGAWGGPGACDVDGSGTIDVVDMFALLGAWGPCP